MSRDGPLEKHPGDLQMGLPVGIREGKTSGHRINPPDENSLVVENRDSAWCFIAHLLGPLVYFTFKIIFFLREAMPLVMLLILRGSAEPFSLVEL